MSLTSELLADSRYAFVLLHKSQRFRMTSRMLIDMFISGYALIIVGTDIFKARVVHFLGIPVCNNWPI